MGKSVCYNIQDVEKTGKMRKKDMFEGNMDRSFLTTYYKHRFNPTKAVEENIIIGDIAHALSLLCRGNGHLRIFYSVAQHSIKTALEAEARGYDNRLQLCCLLHDASEAYIGDVISPLKLQLHRYMDYEENLQKTIYSALEVDYPNEQEWEIVKEIDRAMLYHEFKLLHGDLLFKKEPEIHVSISQEEIPHQQVETEFISLYRRLKEY